MSVSPTEYSEMPKTVKVHVTFDETKRVLSHQKGAEVEGLRHVFVQVFSDVLSSDIAPAHVKFQLYDDQFADYVELSNEERLEENCKIRALVTKQAKQVARHSYSETESQMNHRFWPYFLCMPTNGCCVDWTDIVTATPIYQRPHSVKKNVTYRLWNPVSRQKDSFIQRDPNTNDVNCNGSFNGGVNTVLKAIDETENRTFYVALRFTDDTGQNEFYLTGNGKDQTVTAVDYGNSPIDDKSVFEPLYYWSYTMFRNQSWPELYLGCDHTGKTTLVESKNLNYPNPQALFVLNEYVATTPI